MSDHLCKPAMDLTFVRSGIVDALGIRGDIGRDMSNADLIAAVRKLRMELEAMRCALIETEKSKEAAR